MSAKILSFPSATQGGAADTRYEPLRTLSAIEVERLRERVTWVSGRHNLHMKAIAQNIHNQLWVTFNVARVEDIHCRHFEAAMQVVNKADDDLIVFGRFLGDIRALFVKEVLRGNVPWTPAIQTKWCRRLGNELPDRPDWRAMAVAIEKMQEVKL